MSKWIMAISAMLVLAAIAPPAHAQATEPPSAEPSESGSPEGVAPPSQEAQPLEVISLPDEPKPVTVEPPSKSESIDEVVVTAQRREQSAQDVPISITVFNQEQLSNANITNAGDLANYTPSLSVNTRFGSENTTFTIRGFTQDLRTTASVGTYFAEVVAPRGQTSQASGDGAGPGSLFDVQSVQVLKGPQGTLFGRNTTGGAILIVPNKPSNDFEGYAELSAMNYGGFRQQGVVNLPIIDTVKVRFGIDHNVRDGYLRNISETGARDLNDVDYAVYRLSVLWNVTDDIENYTIFSYTDSSTHGNTAQLFACNPSLNPADNVSLILIGRSCQDQLSNQAAAGKNGEYDVSSTIPDPMSIIRERRAINTTTWTLSENVTFKNIFAYAHLYTESGSQIFGTNFHAIGDLNPNREFFVGLSVPNPDEPVTSQTTFVEEPHLQGTAFDGRFEWQAGAYYERSLPDGFSGNNSAGMLSCDPRTLSGDPSRFDCFDLTLGLIGSVLVQQYKTDYLNQALYAQGTYDFTDELSLTAGLRYTWDRTRGYGIKTRYAFLLGVPEGETQSIVNPEVSSEAPTGMINISYKPNANVMAYGKYNRGYRQGSVNMAADPGLDTFGPEHVNTYEIGAKISFRGAVPGRFNIAAFYNDFTDQQLQAGYVSSNSGVTTTIFNAGHSRIVGFETETYLKLLRDLSLTLSTSYLDTKLLEAENVSQGNLAAGGVLAPLTYAPIADVGDELPYAPDQTYVASLDYHLPIDARVGDIIVGVTYSYIGKQRSASSSSSDFGLLGDYSLLNASINWISIAQSSFDLSLFGTNLLNEKYTTFVSGIYNVLGFESRQVGAPRMFGVRMRYNF